MSSLGNRREGVGGLMMMLVRSVEGKGKQDEARAAIDGGALS